MQGKDGGPVLSRRALMGGMVALAGVAVAGCSKSREIADSSPRTSAGDRTPGAVPASMTVYRDPNCGCCEAWAGLARQAGYSVNLVDRADMPAIKRQLGIPKQLASCHTARVGDYVIEGHVPLAAVQRLLRSKSRDIAGLAVPGMPRGSPGMEMPGGAGDPYQVMAFDKSGRITVFA